MKKKNEDRIASSVPTFNDPALQQAVNEVQPIITNYLFTLDHISADIRAAEQWLQEHGANIEVWEFDPASDAYDEAGDDWALGWAQHQKEDRFRLVHRHARRCYDPDEGGISGRVWVKPFLECAAAERVKRSWLLPGLLRRLAAQLVPPRVEVRLPVLVQVPQGGTEPSVPDEDINF